MLPAAATFTRLVTAELKALGQSDQFTPILGSDIVSVQAIEDARQLAPLVLKWNVYAGDHPPLARVALYERGVRSEVSLGHRGAGKVYP